MIARHLPFYVTGGTLASDAPSYVERQADHDLYEGLQEGAFCYVLTARQMGKSSLMVRTAARLRQDGTAVALLDLTAIGQNLSAEQWYDGLLGDIGEQLGLEEILEEFWLANGRLGPLQRWIRALRQVVLPRCPGRVVLFVDEIDAVRSLPFPTDEFFAAIRECYNRRTEEAALARLTFCLLGVASPSDLIRDTRTTPFNIGRRIELRDFSVAEAAPLAKGLCRPGVEAGQLLERILYWTGGHPYLTQRLCLVVAEQTSVTRPADVDRICDELFLSHRARERDGNLLFVRERLLRGSGDLAGLLELYGRVWRKPVLDDETSPLISVLRLSGVARVVDGRLQVRNRIYERVFDRRWVEVNMPGAEKRRQRRAYRRGLLRASAVLGAILAVVGGLGLFAWRQTIQLRKTNEALQETEQKALEKQQEALENRRIAWEELDEVRKAKRRQVRQLVDAVPDAVPALLAVLEKDRVVVVPRLIELWTDTSRLTKERMRAGLALLGIDATVKAPLTEWMLQTQDPREVLLVRDLLPQHDADREAELWHKAESRSTSSDGRFRALVALARFDPENQRWKKAAPFAVAYLLNANPLHREVWQTGLRPVCDQLLPELRRAFHKGNRSRPSAEVLTDYFAERPEVLADLACDADSEQFGVLRPALEKNTHEVTNLLAAELKNKPADQETEPERIARAKRQANAAAALVVLLQPREGNRNPDPAIFQAVWSLLQHSPTPDARTFLIHGLAPRGADPHVLLRRLEQENDPSIRAALILALGEFSGQQLPGPDRNALVPKLLAWYQTCPNAGIHGTIDWLLRHGQEGPAHRPLDWGQEQTLKAIDNQLARRPAPTGQEWYLNSQGQTLVRVRKPRTFLMGSTIGTDPERSENETPHPRTIGHSFALAAQPVTVAQWEKFREEMKKRHVDIPPAEVDMYAPDPQCPIIDVDWYEAALYCRWLSEVEKVPDEQMVYPRLEAIVACSRPGGRQLATFPLSRTGYRLPTEAEWEYACRAGTTTSWNFGGAVELLPRHAWFWTNSDSRTWPVGQKMPNALGLFDMHGNVWNWCHDPYGPYPEPSTPQEEDRAREGSGYTKVLRGGSFRYKPAVVRSAYRLAKAPTFRVTSVGLRVARTLPAE